MPKNVPLPKKIVLSSISEIRDLRDNEELIEKIKTQEEILAAIWSIDNYLPLYYQRKFNWYTLVYESLVTNPEEEFGLDFYTEDPEPDYDALKNWKPPRLNKPLQDFLYHLQIYS